MGKQETDYDVEAGDPGEKLEKVGSVVTESTSGDEMDPMAKKKPK